MLDGEILVPHINIHITQQQLLQLRQAIDPLGYSDNHGIDIYQVFGTCADSYEYRQLILFVL